MKKLITTLVLVVVVQSAFAQFTKGTILLGGSSSFGFSSMKTTYDGNDYSKTTAYELSPMAGYFVADNIAIGASIDFSGEKTEYEFSDSESKSSGITFSPFARYYLESKVFFEGSSGFGSEKDEFNSGGSDIENDASVFKFGIGVGYAAMISDKVAIEPMIGYGSLSRKYDGDDNKYKTSGFQLGVGVTVYLGGD